MVGNTYVIYSEENCHARGLTFPYVERAIQTSVIFLHGVTDSHRSWELVLPHLDPSIRAIALTQRGHGDASKPADGYSSSDLAGDPAEVMDALAIPSAVIVGHSMGSFVAQRFAAEFPERTAGLVLIGSFATCADNEGVKQFVAEAVEALIPFRTSSLSNSSKIRLIRRFARASST